MGRKKKPKIDRTCFICGAEMNIADNDILLLECPECGNSFLSEERDVALELWLEQEAELAFGSSASALNMPPCCRACGGPWPDCEISCAIFDD